MSKLKSAWELAGERIIVSRFAREREKEKEKLIRKEQERLAVTPDFVIAWEKAQNEEYGESFSPSVIEDVEKNPTKFIPKESHDAEPLGDGGIIVQEPETIYSKPPMEVHWYGHFTSYSGFSRMNRAMAFGLSNRNVKVRIDLQGSAIEINKSTQKELERLQRTEISSSAPKVFGATVPLNMSHGGKKIIYTMMENEETLHRDYVERLNLFDEVWVPTTHGEKIFKKNGVSRPIFVMPLGVETSRYHSKIPPANIPDLSTFRFISVFKWGYRKGYDILLKAYMDEFSSADDVSLILVTRSDLDHNVNRIAEDFKSIRMSIDKTDENLPHICLHNKPVLEKDMPNIYRAGHAFVLISRGEGFGLPYYEAASCGLPVIASNCSGQKDILTEDNSFLVNPDDFVVAKINGPLSKLAKHCHFYENQVFPDFGPNAIMKTREHMRYVYENYSKALAKATKLQQTVRNNYSWEKSVTKVHDRLQHISQ